MATIHELDKGSFGRFLAQLRRERGLTQRDLAEMLFISDKAVSKWERGLSLPDVSLLLPLAEKLGVSVTELLEGRRMPQERQFTQKEVDALIQKALTFQTEPPERQKERVQKYLPVYLVCSVLGIVEALAVWGFGLAETEMARMSLILGVGFGVIYGAYAFFWMAETLPPATTTKTALRSLHRGLCTSTSRASTTTTATGPMSCGRSGPGLWRLCCCCRHLWRWRGSWTRTWAARRPLQHLQCTS